MDENRYTQLMGRQRNVLGGLNAGQAIVIVAVAAVALVAIIGLSVDGGRLLVVRRSEQNASDAATLAATLALCSGGTEAQIIAAGESAATANGYIDGVDNTAVTIDPAPPVSEVPAEACVECTVLVEISREIEPYFIQLVYSGNLAATTKAVGTCNPDNIPVEFVETANGEVPAPDIGVLWTGGPTCEANIQVNDGYLGGNVHSNGTIKFQPSNAGGQNCQSAPSASSNPQGGWVFGNMTYADPSLGNWPDSKIYECDWNQLPGETPDPIVCGATCSLPSDVNNDNDPEQVPAYIDTNGDPIWPEEADYNISEFAPSSALATSLGSQYHVVTSAADLWTQYNDPTTGGPGIYYIDGSISLKKNDVDNPSTDVELTLVATGEVSFHLEHNFKGWYPQMDSGGAATEEEHRLAIFANGDGPSPSCISKDLHVNSTAGQFTGIMFAPYGEAKFSTASTETQHGCVIGYQTSISSSQATLICNPGENNNQGSINMTQ